LYWVLDECWEGEFQQGGVEQLTETALARWKKENEPTTAATGAETPTASPRVT